MILADGMRMAVIGIVPGVLGAYAAARGMSALLFGVAVLTRRFRESPSVFSFRFQSGASAVMSSSGSIMDVWRTSSSSTAPTAATCWRASTATSR